MNKKTIPSILVSGILLALVGACENQTAPSGPSTLSATTSTANVVQVVKGIELQVPSHFVERNWDSRTAGFVTKGQSLQVIELSPGVDLERHVEEYAQAAREQDGAMIEAMQTISWPSADVAYRLEQSEPGERKGQPVRYYSKSLYLGKGQNRWAVVVLSVDDPHSPVFSLLQAVRVAS